MSALAAFLLCWLSLNVGFVLGCLWRATAERRSGRRDEPTPLFERRAS